MNNARRYSYALWSATAVLWLTTASAAAFVGSRWVWVCSLAAACMVSSSALEDLTVRSRLDRAVVALARAMITCPEREGLAREIVGALDEFSRHRQRPGGPAPRSGCAPRSGVVVPLQRASSRPPDSLSEITRRSGPAIQAFGLQGNRSG